MSGTTRTSADLDPRRRRTLFRAWHRGIREMDLIMGRFADAEIGNLSESELDEFEALIEVPDRDLFKWLTARPRRPRTTTRRSGAACATSTATTRRSIRKGACR